VSAPYPYRPHYAGYPYAGYNHGNGYSYDPSQAGYWQGHGQFLSLRYQSLETIPAVWEPFTVYYIKAATERTARHFYTDAQGQPFPVSDAAYEEWKSRLGNSTKTVAEFVDAITASTPAAVAGTLISADVLPIPNQLALGTDGKLYVGIVNINGGTP
jgi:hypothetical protein